MFTHKLLHLVHCKQLTNQQIFKILQQDPLLEHLYRSPITTLRSTLQLNHQQITLLEKQFHQINIDKLLQLYKDKDIHFITYFDEVYPENLKEIYNPPLVLFYKGDLRLLTKKAIAIVGARDANYYGKQVLYEIVPRLVKENYVIISGLALGIDSYAHYFAMQSSGQTIAVLGSGFFHIYPQQNKQLALDIGNNHLLLSEYPPVEKAEKWKFPMRNRIISGLSLGTFVVQAKARSGSLITADFALEQGREVFAAPGAMNDPLSAGTNYLIQQGAKMVINATSITEELTYLSKK